jgi:hypothetical protein
MKKLIENLLNEIPKNVVFDSHFIIRQLRFRYSYDYVNFFKKKVLSTHGRIGKEIAKFEGILVEKQKSKSYSENIHRRNSRCALWKNF